MPHVADIANRLVDNAGRYFPRLAGVGVRAELRRVSRRAAGFVYQFELISPEGCTSVVVKLPRERRAPGEIADRPRLAPLCDAAKKYRYEHDALSAIHAYFGSLNDPRFDAVQVLDAWPEAQAVVMRAVDQPRLRDLLRQCCRESGDATGIEIRTAMRHAGAWLRAYQQLPPLPHTRPRHARRADFIEAATQWVDYLAAGCRDNSMPHALAGRLERAALRFLPQDLPLGLRHGDFAPRNVFVGPQGRVTVFDTLARWQAPVCEDLGSFLVELKWNMAQDARLGWLFLPRARADWERAFLQGYFAKAAVPLASVRLFEVQWLLQKWCSQEQVCRSATGLRRLMTPLRRALGIRFRRQIESLLIQLESVAKRTEPRPRKSAIPT